jgi:hypothetical protein
MDRQRMVDPVRAWRRLRSLTIAGGIASCASLATAIGAHAGAPTGIVVNTSINRIRLGATEATVREALGTPTNTAKCSVFTVCIPGGSPGTVSWTYGRTTWQQTAYVFIQGRVGLMGTYSSAERTADDVGPDSSLASARQHYPHLAFHHFRFLGPPSGYYVTAPPTASGQVFTLVVGERGKVDWIEIGRWDTSRKYVCDFTLCS